MYTCIHIHTYIHMFDILYHIILPCNIINLIACDIIIHIFATIQQVTESDMM